MIKNKTKVTVSEKELVEVNRIYATDSFLTFLLLTLFNNFSNVFALQIPAKLTAVMPTLMPYWYTD